MNKCKYCNSTIPPDDLCPRCISILNKWYKKIVKDNNSNLAKTDKNIKLKDTKSDD